MSNSCGGLDTSVPDEIAEVMKTYIKRTKPRPYLDQTDEGGKKSCCLLEDLEGARCPEGTCRYNRDGTPTRNYKSHKPIP